MENTVDTNLKKLTKDMVLCRWCNKPIMSSDKICKHCNEYQKDEDIMASEKDLLRDSTLSIFDWIMVISFQLLGILVGLYHRIKGEKKRSATLILYSLISILFNTTLGYTIYHIYNFISKIIKVTNEI